MEPSTSKVLSQNRLPIDHLEGSLNDLLKMPGKVTALIEFGGFCFSVIRMNMDEYSCEYYSSNTMSGIEWPYGQLSN